MTLNKANADNAEGGQMNIKPMNLQFFAEEETPEPEVKETEAKEPEVKETDETKDEPKDKQPSIQELLTRIATLERKADKASSEAADWKKKYRSTLGEKEILDAEKAERDAQVQEELKELKRRDAIHNFTENFLDLGYSKELAKKAATAQADGDSDALHDIQKQAQEAQKKEWEAQFYKNNKLPINAGTGDKTITKEQFDAMGLDEKTKLFRENRAEYNRLNAM